VQDFSQPDFNRTKIEGDYDATVDLAEAAAFARRPEIRRGEVRLTGHGSWSTQDFSSIGKVLLSNLNWRDSPMGIHNANLSAQYAGDSKRMVLSQIQGKVLGGSVTGDADVSQWLNLQTPTAAAKTKESERQAGVVRLRLKDLSAAEIAAAVSTPSRPFHKVKLAGLLSGNVDARWKGSPRNTEAQFVADVAPPASASGAQLPITAHAQGTYRAGAGELQLDQLNASTRATQVHASGTFSSSAALKLSVTTTDLSEWKPVFSAAGYGGPVPVTLKGQASFNGTATGKISEIMVAGNLQSQDFETLIPATSQSPERMVSWNALHADVQLSPSVFAVRNGTLSRDPDSLKFDFHLSLSQRQFTDASAFQVHLDTENADVAGILALAGYSYPVTGIMNVQLQAAGTRLEPRGQGHILLRDGTLYGEPIERFSAALDFSGGEFGLRGIELKHYQANVSGDAAYNPTSQAFHFNLKGANFDLAPIAKLQMGHVEVSGLADFSASGSGTLDAPAIDAAVHVRDLAFDRERAGDFTIRAVSQGSEVRITGQSAFEQADLKVDGNVQARGDWLADVYFRFRQFDVDSILRVYIPQGVTGHSRADGQVHLVGPLRRPRELQVTASLDGLEAGIENVTLHNDGPVRFSIANQALKIDQFHLIGDETDISATGTVQLTGERDLDVRAQGRVNLKLIETFRQDLSS
jgi:translocation and assembly module TamB